MAEAPEFSRTVTVAALDPGGETHRLAATAPEREALARRLGVEAVESLEAELSVVPKGRGVVLVRGRVQARLGRLCVVSLTPLVEEIDERFAIRFLPEVGASARAGPVALDASSEDEEPYEGSTIDLGEAVAQTVALALEPWPRAPGAALPPEAETRH